LTLSKRILDVYLKRDAKYSKVIFYRRDTLLTGEKAYADNDVDEVGDENEAEVGIWNENEDGDDNGNGNGNGDAVRDVDGDESAVDCWDESKTGGESAYKLASQFLLFEDSSNGDMIKFKVAMTMHLYIFLNSLKNEDRPQCDGDVTKRLYGFSYKNPTKSIAPAPIWLEIMNAYLQRKLKVNQNEVEHGMYKIDRSDKSEPNLYFNTAEELLTLRQDRSISRKKRQIYSNVVSNIQKPWKTSILRAFDLLRSKLLCGTILLYNV